MLSFLVEQFGVFPAWLLGGIFIFFRYAVFAGPAFLFFYLLRQKQWRLFKIQQKRPNKQIVLSEITHSVLTALIFALAGIGIYGMSQAGWTEIYTDIQEFGVLYLLLSFISMVLIHDTYFYWIHRAMHSKFLYRQLHRVHHQSHNPTPWAALSFHPSEALLEVAILPILTLVMPFHPIVLFAYTTWSLAWNIIGHLGYEIFPAYFVRHPFFQWFNTSTHHNMHHKHFHCNYGLYFNFWDRLMGTNHPEYLHRFDEIVHRKSELERC
ncbi:MAG TPA: sterol desaturase family protein [Saprospiraceae bacterium]|nr:sterol desaturase family protein [Saprospiraceae bacterium]HMQ84954.1 sterol desaturase family protein [Saprospiraceae bacterium]